MRHIVRIQPNEHGIVVGQPLYDHRAHTLVERLEIEVFYNAYDGPPVEVFIFFQHDLLPYGVGKPEFTNGLLVHNVGVGRIPREQTVKAPSFHHAEPQGIDQVVINVHLGGLDTVLRIGQGVYRVLIELRTGHIGRGAHLGDPWYAL